MVKTIHSSPPCQSAYAKTFCVLLSALYASFQELTRRMLCMLVGLSMAGNAECSASFTSDAPCALQARGNFIELTAVELYGRWGSWFLTLSTPASPSQNSTQVDIRVEVEEGGCPGQPACSGHGVCLRNSQLDWFCRCEPGWFGHVCEVCSLW